MRNFQPKQRFRSDVSKMLVGVLIIVICFIAGSTDLEVSSAADIRGISAPDNVPAKKYLQMSDEERRQYIARRAREVARTMGFTGEEATPAAVEQIKLSVDAYASRVNSERKVSCGFGDNLQATFERARNNAPFIFAAFNKENVEPRIGLYLAMIESAHCPCIQSPTGPLGLYQFSRADARKFGLNAFAEASTLNPDDRCGPKAAALAAAKQLKSTAQSYRTSELRLPMAIIAFGERDAFKMQPDQFWTLVSNGERFLRNPSESRRLPAFFASAIIGENPEDFGLEIQPLSVYTS